MSANNITFILHKPQLSENIGACARGMKNFNFQKLSVIDPRPIFPNDKILATSVGAKNIINKSKVFDHLEPALKNIDYVIATSARFRNKNIKHIQLEDLKKITTNTAAVILETIQGGAGFIVPQNNYLAKVKKRCEDVGALMIVDEIQTGIGRTGKFWGFENYGIIPDIIITGKGLGGGMPIGAFIAQQKLMDLLKDQQKLGHITTFGGHPVIASAAVATINILQNSTLIEETLEKEKLIRKLLKHPKIKEIRGKGLMLAAIVESNEIAANIIHKCLEEGLILFFLLFEGKAIRITPPLTISKKEISKGCEIIMKVIDNLEQ